MGPRLFFLLLVGWAAGLQAQAPVPVAEYEPSRGALVTFGPDFSVPLTFLRQVTEAGTLVCLVTNVVDRERASKRLASGGIPGTKVSFVLSPFDSPWVRDYGPIFVRKEGKLEAVGFRYDRPRPADQIAQEAIARHLGLPFRPSPLTLTGGNQFFDGSRLLASTLVWVNRPRPWAEDRLRTDLGVTETLTFPDPLNNYHQHANCWLKVLGPRNIALMEVPTHPAHQALVEIAAALRAQGYRVNPIPCPEGKPYLNSVLLGGTIYVPTVGQPDDEVALAAYRRAAPGWKVVGIWSDSWLATDALGCRVLPLPRRGAYRD